MELRHLRYFLTVAEELNFSRAALRLNISQPPLSQQIKALEAKIGAPLFRRLSHGVELTSAGLAFQQEAYRAVESAEKAVLAAQRAARGVTGNLRLGFTSSAAFNPLLAARIRDFQREWPEVRLDLVENNTLYLLESLLEDRLDVIYMRPGIHQPDNIELYRLPDEAMKVVVPATHPLAQQKSVNLLQLKDELFILFPAAVGLTLFDEIMICCRAAGFEPKRTQVAPQMSSVVNFVAAEMGVSLVPASVSQIQVHNVRYLDIVGISPLARLAVATRRHEPSILVKHFVQGVSGKKGRA